MQLTGSQGEVGILLAFVPSEELKCPGYAHVMVSNPQPGGGVSNSLTFRIFNSVPQIESITPVIVDLAAPADVIRVKGKNFLPDSVITLDGKNLKTRFISSIVLEANLDIADIKEPAKYPVTVTNPSPIRFTSNTVFLNLMDHESFQALSEHDALITAQADSENSTASLTGKILDTYKMPIEGVTIQIRNVKTLTDSNGKFTLSGVPSGKQHLMIHGETAKGNDHRPTIPLTVEIKPGIVNQMPDLPAPTEELEFC